VARVIRLLRFLFLRPVILRHRRAEAIS
jgi:hypothetical protein